jgi:type I restriction enzyme M protein
VILTNPPFGSRLKKHKDWEADKYTDEVRIAKYCRYEAYDNALRQINDNIDKPLLNFIQNRKITILTEVLFIELFKFIREEEWVLYYPKEF